MNKLHHKFFPIHAVNVMLHSIDRAQLFLIRNGESKRQVHLQVAVIYIRELDAMRIARMLSFEKMTEAEKVVGWFVMGSYDFWALIRSTESIAQIPGEVSFPGEVVFTFLDGSTAAFSRKALTIRVIN